MQMGVRSLIISGIKKKFALLTEEVAEEVTLGVAQFRTQDCKNKQFFTYSFEEHVDLKIGR